MQRHLETDFLLSVTTKVEVSHGIKNFQLRRITLFAVFQLIRGSTRLVQSYYKRNVCMKQD